MAVLRTELNYIPGLHGVGSETRGQCEGIEWRQTEVNIETGGLLFNNPHGIDGIDI